MHPVINGVICPKCGGSGVKPIPADNGKGMRMIREVCPICKGGGIIRYEGKRNGIEWEGE